MSNDTNLNLWNSVHKTDPSTTKNAKVGQMNITAICPQFQRKKATEKFGPYGLGWGVTDQDYHFIDYPNETKLCTYTATFWYKLDGERGEFPIQANIKLSYITKNGKGYLLIDDEFAKKVATDALTKGLSMLGFNSDVFEGKFDDNKYVNQMREEHSPTKPQQAEKQQPTKIIIQRDQIADSIATCPTMESLGKLWNSLDKRQQNEYAGHKDKRKSELTPS